MSLLTQFKRVAAVASIYLLWDFASPYATAAEPCRDWNVDRHPRLMADINTIPFLPRGVVRHDGKSDIVGFGDAGVWTALATGEGGFAAAKLVLTNFGSNQGWAPSKHTRLLADINNDGLADIVGFGDDGVWIALATGDGGFAAAKFVLAGFGLNQGWAPSKHLRLLVDINKDNLADIVAFGNDGVWTALATGDGGFAPSKLVLADFGVTQGWDPSKHARVMADINRDGTADIVAFGYDGVSTALATGDGGFAPPKLVLADFGMNHGWDPSKHVRMMADINKDSMADIVAFGYDGVWTALAIGDGGFAPPKLVLADFGVTQGWDPSKHVRVMADVNKDGMADIVAFGYDGVWTALATGDGGFAPPKLVLADFGMNQGWDRSKHVRTLADVNGDGMPDVVGFGDAGVLTALSTGDGGFGPTRLVLGEIFSCAGRFDFNLEWGAVDLGGFPLNPRWRWQRDKPGVPSAGLCHYFTKLISAPTGSSVPLAVADFADCTDQTDLSHVDTPVDFDTLVCSLESSKGFHGHLNWFAATFTGTLTFGDHNFDDDYYLALTTDGAPAILSGDEDPPRAAMHTEFNAEETIKYFPTRWWKSFRDAVDRSYAAAAEIERCAGFPDAVGCPLDPVTLASLQESVKAPKAMFTDNDGKATQAIMTGLFGVDLEHGGGKSELHPVYAIAANVKDDPADNVWAIFVRNTGNEGYCSHRIWKAEFTTYTFRLPWREGMNSLEVLRGPDLTQFAGTTGTSGPAVVFTPGQGVDVTFTLPSPSQTPLIEGDLHLRWLGPTPPPIAAAARPTPGPQRGETHDEAGPVRKALNRLPPAKRRQVEEARALPQTITLKLHPVPSIAAASQVRELTAPPPAAVRLGTKADVATRKIARDDALLRALCEAWDGSPPGLPPDLCKKLPR